MRILITNDDGINAPGLRVLEGIAARLAGDTGELWTVAPAFEQSGVGHCINYTKPTLITQLAAARLARPVEPGLGRRLAARAGDLHPADCTGRQSCDEGRTAAPGCVQSTAMSDAPPVQPDAAPRPQPPRIRGSRLPATSAYRQPPSPTCRCLRLPVAADRRCCPSPAVADPPPAAVSRARPPAASYEIPLPPCCCGSRMRRRRRRAVDSGRVPTVPRRPPPPYAHLPPQPSRGHPSPASGRVPPARRLSPPFCQPLTPPRIGGWMGGISMTLGRVMMQRLLPRAPVRINCLCAPSAPRG